LFANVSSTASVAAPLTRSFCSQYLRTPAALATLIFDTPGKAVGMGGADNCAIAACDQSPVATMQHKDPYECSMSAILSAKA
jgi:hypothetical protein